ncbi:arsenate reductase [Moraxella caviae]|uniref:Arsenate reductase n=1 Tax=Moraxella caviae TaxID=34060 RepID=A0A1S9ZX57_9GAMM|nr:ArsC/Spx/MgsR family protein [Moraxella caviae]OOR88084.1 arsenate reductase [Moraxella caviae]STZ09973.1 putative reductase [Moraxella caviae]
MLTIYGIKNCNTMKKAFDFLANKGVAHEFFDYKKSVLDVQTFAQMAQEFGLDKVINKKGTTYRAFDDAAKAVLTGTDVQAIYEIVKDKQSVLKRPMLIGEKDGKKIALIGFDESEWAAALA